KGMTHLEMLELSLGKWISEARAQDDQRPPQHRADRIAECRSSLMEAHPAIDGASETVATRTIKGILTEKNQDQKAERAPYTAKCKRHQKECRVKRHQNRERNQEAEQELVRGAGILKALARKLGAGPKVAADISGEPEPVYAERRHGKPDAGTFCCDQQI